jgi:putative resolvase
VARLAALATENDMRVAKVVAEVGSGLNGHRKGLLFVLRSPDDGALVVEHRDRLAQFGSECIEAALAATGRGVVVVDPAKSRTIWCRT